ncbi:MAG: hypothetical protein R2756_07515 [Bacteroidales bacterium]
MENRTLEIETAIQVLKTPHEVFEAIVDPAMMSNYFISRGSGRLDEGKRELDEAGLKWLQGNTAGWANFLACLKAYLEYGINLRVGAFDFMTDK